MDALADTGADHLFAMIDGGRPGAIEACRRRGVAQIGNVLDWTARAPDVFVAAALADSGWGVREAAREFIAGSLPLGGRRTIGLEDPAVVSLVLGPRADPSLAEILSAWRMRILDRTLEVATEYDGPEFAAPA